MSEPRAGVRTPELTVDGERFLLDGKPHKMRGVRVAFQLKDDAHTEDLLTHLDEWCAHGVSSIAPWLYGATTKEHNVFGPDGSVDAAVLGRLQRVLEAAAARNMSVIVGLFFKNQVSHFQSALAVERAVAEVTQWLVPHRHALLDLTNEFHCPEYDASPFPFRDPQAIGRLFEIVHHVDPRRLVGAGARGKAFIMPVARLADVVLHNDPVLAEELLFVERVGKPVVDVEAGGHAHDHFRRTGAGIFGEAAQLFYRHEIHSANAIPGKNVFFHAHWIQQPPRRCALGGDGTPENPGIHWYFDLLARSLGLRPHGDEWCFGPWEAEWAEGQKGAGYDRFLAAAMEPALTVDGGRTL